MKCQEVFFFFRDEYFGAYAWEEVIDLYIWFVSEISGMIFEPIWIQFRIRLLSRACSYFLPFLRVLGFLLHYGYLYCRRLLNLVMLKARLQSFFYSHIIQKIKRKFQWIRVTSWIYSINIFLNIMHNNKLQWYSNENEKIDNNQRTTKKMK